MTDARKEENRERVKIKLTDPGLIELEKLMKKLDSTKYADTLRASEKINRLIREQHDAEYAAGHEIIIKSKEDGK